MSCAGIYQPAAQEIKPWNRITPLNTNAAAYPDLSPDRILQTQEKLGQGSLFAKKKQQPHLHVLQTVEIRGQKKRGKPARRHTL